MWRPDYTAFRLSHISGLLNFPIPSRLFSSRPSVRLSAAEGKKTAAFVEWLTSCLSVERGRGRHDSGLRVGSEPSSQPTNRYWNMACFRCISVLTSSDVPNVPIYYIPSYIPYETEPPPRAFFSTQRGNFFEGVLWLEEEVSSRRTHNGSWTRRGTVVTLIHCCS